MGKIYYRPQYAVDYGQVETVGSGSVLGDNSDGSFKRYYENAGSVLVYPAFNPALVPGGREVIAVRAGHRQRNTGFLGLFNGWVATYLRIGNARQMNTKAYVQDGYSDPAREILGPALHKAGLVPWTAAEISTMSTDSGAVVGQMGPNTNNRWCVASESFVVVVYSDAVPVPSSPYPANNETVSTSSVNFSAVQVATQTEQPVLAVFQVARDSGFTSDVRTFIGGLNQSTAGGSRSYYTSNKLNASYTNLGPGRWYLRMKGRDYRGQAYESAWGGTTSFVVQHGALPVPTLIAPQPGTITPNPFSIRGVQFNSEPSGDRRVGATWQFSQDPTFATGVVSWVNRTGGILLPTPIAGQPWPAADAVVNYDPQPVATTAPGLAGGTVSLEDPSQYLTQGVWYARVRATDIFDQSGAWSSNFTFQVRHVPVVGNTAPRLNAAFDQAAAPVQWEFTDPWSGDSQSSYQMKVYDASDNLLQDTGKISSMNGRATMAVPTSRLRTLLKYSLTIWDQDDVPSATAIAGNLLLSKVPVTTLPFPAVGEAIVTGQPQLTWSSVFAAAGITQKSFQVKFLRADSGVTEFDSGVITTATASYMPPRAVLKNLRGYQLALTVTDTENLSATLLRNFSTSFEQPNPVVGYADADGYTDSGYVTVLFPSAVPDAYFFEWRIYRRRAGTTEWAYAGAVPNPAARSFRDWLVAGSGQWEYTVTQAATRFGSIVESATEPDPESVMLYSDSYWFIVEGAEDDSVRLHRVTADKYSSPRESNTFVIIGGGRRRNLGTRIGKEGNLTATIRHSAQRTPGEQIALLESLNQDSRPVIMRDPFGNLTRVSIGDISLDRVIAGDAEFADLDIPYYEVM